MAVITTSSLPRPSRTITILRGYRLYLVIGVAIGACTRYVIRWTMQSSDAYNSALLQMPDHIHYFPHGEKGYLKEHYCIDNSRQEECCNEYHCTKFVNRSTLYSDCCGRAHNTDHKTMTRGGNQRSHLLPLLITSAPRSGTRFIQQLFTRVGLTGLTTDEHSPQSMGTVSWKHVFDDDHYLTHDKKTHLYQSKFRVIWHLVRDPLKALTSMAFTEPLLEQGIQSERYLTYISKHIHLTNSSKLCKFFGITDQEWEDRATGDYNARIDKFLVYRSMEIYLHWHGFINYLNVPIFRLEDLSVEKNITVLDEIFYSVNLKPPRHSLVQAFLDAQPKENTDWNWRRRLLEEEEQEESIIDGDEQSNEFEPAEQPNRRLKVNGKDQNGGVKVLLHKNERNHREALKWSEVCDVNKRKARELLKMSQSFGYYTNLDAETVCPKADV